MLLWPTRRLIHLFAEEEQLLLRGKHINEFCHHLIEPLQHLCAGVGNLTQARILEMDAVDGIVFDSELVLKQISYGTDSSVAQVVDIVHIATAVVKMHNIVY